LIAILKSGLKTDSPYLAFNPAGFASQSLARIGFAQKGFIYVIDQNNTTKQRYSRRKSCYGDDKKDAQDDEGQLRIISKEA